MPAYPKPPPRKKKKKVNLSPVFRSVWSKRRHVSQLSGKPLYLPGFSKWHFQFLHVLGKQRYPECADKEWNILLALPEEHQTQEQYNVFRAYQDYCKATIAQGAEPDQLRWFAANQ